MIKIEYIYAGLLLHNAKKPINEDTIKKVLSASGVEVDAARIKALVAALSEVNIDEVIKAAAVPVAVAPVATVAPAAPTAEAKKEAKEETKAEASEEETAEGLGSLFG